MLQKESELETGTHLEVINLLESGLEHSNYKRILLRQSYKSREYQMAGSKSS